MRVALMTRDKPGADEIVRMLRDDPGSGAITVVTSDATLAGRARAAGAQVYPASGFRALLEASAR